MVRWRNCEGWKLFSKGPLRIEIARALYIRVTKLRVQDVLTLRADLHIYDPWTVKKNGRNLVNCVFLLCLFLFVPEQACIPIREINCTLQKSAIFLAHLSQHLDTQITKWYLISATYKTKTSCFSLGPSIMRYMDSWITTYQPSLHHLEINNFP